MAKSGLQSVSASLCTDAGGIEIAETNLGVELRKWLLAANQNVAYISEADGTITIGDMAGGTACNLVPVKFEVSGKLSEQLKCLDPNDATFGKCSESARQALIDGINSQLPDGYAVDASQFADVDVNYDPNTGDITVDGELYAGAGKDPAALVEALKKYVEKSGGLDINGSSVKNVDVDDGNAMAQCKIKNTLDAAVCDPAASPGAATIPGSKSFGPMTPSAGGEDGEAADMSGDNKAQDGDQTMLVVGTVLITLAVVGAVVGTIMAIKIFNKRRASVSAGNFRSSTMTHFVAKARNWPMHLTRYSSSRGQLGNSQCGDVEEQNNTDPSDGVMRSCMQQQASSLMLCSFPPFNLTIGCK